MTVVAPPTSSITLPVDIIEADGVEAAADDEEDWRSKV